MPGGSVHLNRKKMNHELAKSQVKTIPLNKLKYFNPVAAQIKKELGKNYKVLSLVEDKKGTFREQGIKTVIFTMNADDVHTRRKETPIRVADALVSVTRFPNEKSLYITINSRIGEARYKPELVAKTKKVVEEVLKGRGIAFTTKNREYYTKYKLNFVATDSEIVYGRFERRPAANWVINRIPQRKYTIITTGKLKEPHMPYHR